MELYIYPVLLRAKQILFINEQYVSPKGLAKVALGGFFLGCTLTLGVCVSLLTSFMREFFVWVALLSFFHLMEFLMTALYQPGLVSQESFLFDHSPEYHKALLAACVEYIVEKLFFPSLKEYSGFFWVGLLLVIGGQLVRSFGMLTAATNFTHMVAEVKLPTHKLVTDGIYSICRHPAYCGWFVWAIGCQLLLMNPLCAVLFTFVSWKFFQDRIAYEEKKLLRFFGDEYVVYQQKVHSGIPFL